MTPAIRHEAARRLAYQLVGIIAPCLRQEEQLEALREFYEAIRVGLDEFEAANGVPPRTAEVPGRAGTPGGKRTDSR